MKLLTSVKKASTFSLFAAVLALGLSSPAFAHVTVKPAEVVTAGYQIFTVSVPNEKETPTVSVKVVIPDSVASVTPTQKAGWQISKEADGNGEDTRTTSLTWSGSEIGNGLRDEFTFSAKVPEAAGELQWKAYQTYADGTVVAWDKASSGGHGHDSEDPNSGPFSVTKVVSETTQDAATKKVDQAAADAKSAATQATSFAVIALIVSLVGVFLSTRKNNLS